jgi:hypothetical protein
MAVQAFIEWIIAPILGGVMFAGIGAITIILFIVISKGINSRFMKFGIEHDSRIEASITFQLINGLLFFFFLWLLGIAAFAVCREIILWFGDLRWTQPVR